MIVDMRDLLLVTGFIISVSLLFYIVFFTPYFSLEPLYVIVPTLCFVAALVIMAFIIDAKITNAQLRDSDDQI